MGETIDDVNEPIYPTIPAEIPGVVLEDDYVDKGASLEDPIPPTHRERPTAAASTTNLTTTPVVVPPIPPEIRPIAHYSPNQGFSYLISKKILKKKTMG